jgi:acetyl esterase/lipase
MNDLIESYAAKADVKPVSIPGYWLDKEGMDIPIGTPLQLGEKVILSLHGGAYVLHSASPHDLLANIARGLLKHCNSVRRIFMLEYRLSRGLPNPPANPFPAALLDALAGYVYLTQDVGISPADIVVEGDSAGANLTHALTRYLVENQGMEGLPAPPGALILLSPWVDLTTSDQIPGSSLYTNLASDYLGLPTSPDKKYARGAFLGPLGMDGALNRYISPASVDPRMPPVSFVGFPRTLVVSGEAETLVTQIEALVKKMEKDMGPGRDEGQVEYYESPDSVHDHLAIMFHEPERTQTLRVIADWLG